MNPPDLLDLLLEFYRDKLSEVLRHQEGARHITQYDFNNTYQYIIAREDTQLAWLSAALAELGDGRVEVAAPVAEIAAKSDGHEGRRRNLESQISNFKFQISNFKSEDFEWNRGSNQVTSRIAARSPCLHFCNLRFEI